MHIPAATSPVVHAGRDCPLRRGRAPPRIIPPTPFSTPYYTHDGNSPVPSSVLHLFLPSFSLAAVSAQNIQIFRALVSACSSNQALALSRTPLREHQDSALLPLQNEKDGLKKAPNNHKVEAQSAQMKLKEKEFAPQPLPQRTGLFIVKMLNSGPQMTVCRNLAKNSCRRLSSLSRNKVRKCLTRSSHR